MYLVFDTETTGLPKNFNAPISDTENWPRVVQIAWQLHDEWGNLLEQKDFIIRPVGFNIPFKSESIHGISTELASMVGEELEDVLYFFQKSLQKAKFIVGHNVNFDINVVSAEFYRTGQEVSIDKPILDTCTEHTALLLQLPGGKGGKYKLPTLTELSEYLFDETFEEAHNASADVESTARCFLELIRREYFSLESIMQHAGFFEEYKLKNPDKISLVGLTHVNLKKESAKLRPGVKKQGNNGDSSNLDISSLTKLPFGHLHNHTQYSILQSTTEVNALVHRAIECEMDAVAITDTGNMMAAFHFEKAISSYNQKVIAERNESEAKGIPFTKKELLPIIGCEFNLCKNRSDKTQKDNGYQIVLLAKNKAGYENLMKLASIAYTEGMYYVPRIDREILSAHANDLIALSGHLLGELPHLILNVGERQAEEALLWWKSLFGDDFYLELNRHHLEDEERVNATLVDFSRKHKVKTVATNNTYYLSKEDAVAHDVLLCVKDNELVQTPKGKGRGYRFGLENDHYYFKTKSEMIELFADIPEAIESIGEIVHKCQPYGLSRDVLLPAFEIPKEFQDSLDLTDGGKRGENNYLRYLTMEGSKKRYTEITKEIEVRIEFELETIQRTGYPGYFLIVQDFCQAARDMGVSVGPGRGSAAGSVVAYCTGITNVDPIKYDLLFERFLNPDRVSMPDIDIDFDDEGRGKVINYVINKYGANQVAQIITYGTMAAKSAIRDTARVMNLPLPEADRLAKMIFDLSLKDTINLDEAILVDKLRNQEAIAAAKELRKIAQSRGLEGEVLRKAMEIEGSVRNTGIHACGVIITPDDLTKFVPVALAKDSDLVCTQYDNSVAESAGLLKMDFLGLKTLTLIKDAVQFIKEVHQIELDPDSFPIDDEKTYTLFQRGETVGIFQYESTGMQKYLKELRPTEFADLIAMNALYRPGPMEYIPSFCRRKHGEEEIIYDLPECEENLKETYGITVYQEQVMLLSQKLADFTKGEADTLRKAMGKKDRKVLDKMKPTFIERASEKGFQPEILKKIWKDWEAFASYAFNKSHSTCYAWVAYQTAYLKANYPAEYMASVLSNNMNDIKQVSFFMEECRRMGIDVFGPDINESNYAFTVTQAGAIRFGLGAIKGIGEGPVDMIIKERNLNGHYSSIFDLTKRLPSSACNRRVLENLVYSGGLDSFNNMHRAQYFVQDSNGKLFLETAIRFGSSHQGNSNAAQQTIFELSDEVSAIEPTIPKCDEWPSIYKLNKEKEVVGIFISGHPLDDFKIEISSFCNGTIGMLQNMKQHVNKEIMLAAIVTDGEHRMTKNGDAFGTISIEDYNDSFKIFLFKENYLKFKHFMEPGTFVIIRGRIEVPKYRTELEFVISSIELLNEFREKKTKQISIKLSNREVDQLMLDKLNNLFTQNTGNCQVHFTIYDVNEGIEINMPSRSVRVKPSKELFQELAALDLKFRLN